MAAVYSCLANKPNWQLVEGVSTPQTAYIRFEYLHVIDACTALPKYLREINARTSC